MRVFKCKECKIKCILITKNELPENSYPADCPSIEGIPIWKESKRKFDKCVNKGWSIGCYIDTNPCKGCIDYAIDDRKTELSRSEVD